MDEGGEWLGAVEAVSIKGDLGLQNKRINRSEVSDSGTGT